jgi:hypothetical protein
MTKDPNEQVILRALEMLDTGNLRETRPGDQYLFPKLVATLIREALEARTIRLDQAAIALCLAITGRFGHG